jgi:3',5'-cyclic AMP phosphodiesterase CpdA
VTTTRSLRVVQVSDSHLAPDLESAERNWSAVVEHLAADPPDLVVHTGDITIDGAHRDDHLDHGRARLDELPCPWMAIPGNHDIGDMAPTTMPITAARRDAYEARFGPGNWSTEVGAWRIVGIDVQALVGLTEEDQRWQWLGEELAADGPKMLCCHRPLWPAPRDGEHPSRYVPEPARSRLGELAAAGDVRVIATGHVHQWASLRRDGINLEWAPSTWAVLPESVQPTIVTKEVGFLEHLLGHTVTSRVVTPSAVTRFTIGVDFESPYDH